MDWDSALPGCDLRIGEPMARHTSFQVGGPADCLMHARSPLDIALGLEGSRRLGFPLTIIGKGTNLLVRDGGIRGLVIKIAEGMARVSVEGIHINAQAGASLRRAANAALEAGLSGLEFAAGIPGGVGGAVAMNAGAYGGEMADVVESVTAIARDGLQVTLTKEELAFGYRQSVVMQKDMIVTEARFALRPGGRGDIRALMDDFAARRAEKQPLNLPSAGSTFKRPPGHFAGGLIESAGLKGLSVGGAMVSPKHAGFIVNTGGASARDILSLMEKVRKTVRAQFGVELEPEVRVLGEE